MYLGEAIEQLQEKSDGNVPWGEREKQKKEDAGDDDGGGS